MTILALGARSARTALLKLKKPNAPPSMEKTEFGLIQSSMPDKLKSIIRDTWPQLSRPHATVGKAEKLDGKLRRFYFG